VIAVDLEQETATQPDLFGHLDLMRSVGSGLGEFGRWGEADELALGAIEFAVAVPRRVVGPALGGLVYVAGGPRANKVCTTHGRPDEIPEQRVAAMQAVQLANRGADRQEVIALARSALASPGRAEVGTFWYAVCALAYAGEVRMAQVETERAFVEGWAGHERARLALALLRGRLASLIGDPRSAVALLTDVIEGDVDGQFSGLALAWTVAALVQLGDVAEAEELIERHDAGGALEGLPDRAELLYARGSLYLAAGRPRAADEDLLACGRELASWGVTNPAVVPWRAQAAVAAHALQRHSLAVTLAHEELVLARRWGTYRTLGTALHALAAVSGEKVDVSLLAEASDLLRRSGAVGELVRVEYERGVALVARRQYAAARTALRSAWDAAKQLGSPAWMRRADEVTKLFAAQDHRPTLTRQERKVAELARAGWTNGEIAEQLNLAPRTVEFHLSGVYRKLGVAGRSGLLQSSIPLG